MKTRKKESYIQGSKTLLLKHGSIGYHKRQNKFRVMIGRGGKLFDLPKTKDEREAQCLADLLRFILYGEDGIKNLPDISLKEKIENIDKKFLFYLGKIADSIGNRKWEVLSGQSWEEVKKGQDRQVYLYGAVRIETLRPLTKELEEHFTGIKRISNLRKALKKEIKSTYSLTPDLHELVWCKGIGYIYKHAWETARLEEVARFNKETENIIQEDVAYFNKKEDIIQEEGKVIPEIKKYLVFDKRKNNWCVKRSSSLGLLDVRCIGTIEEAMTISDVLDILFIDHLANSFKYFPNENLESLWAGVSCFKRKRILDICNQNNIFTHGLEAPTETALKEAVVQQFTNRRKTLKSFNGGKTGYHLESKGYKPVQLRDGKMFRLPVTQDEEEAKYLADLLIYIIRGDTEACNYPDISPVEKMSRINGKFYYFLEKIVSQSCWEISKKAWEVLNGKEQALGSVVEGKVPQKDIPWNVYTFKKMKVFTKRPLSEALKRHFMGEKRLLQFTATLLEELKTTWDTFPALSDCYWIDGEGYVLKTDWKAVLGKNVIGCKQTITSRIKEIHGKFENVTELLKSSPGYLDFCESKEYGRLRNNHRYHSRIEMVLLKMLQDSGENVLDGEYLLKRPEGKKPFQLDLYLPDRGIAFECNGNYWHSTFKHEKGYHKMKTEMCLENGIKLYHLWQNPEEMIKKIVRAKLGLLPKIWARKCKVVIVPRDIAIRFFEKNHTHGYAGEFITYGLEHKGELVSALAFRRGGERVENARFVFGDCAVVGGFSRLLKHFIEDYGKEFKEIITFCDRDLTPDWRDAVYYKNGFEFLGDSGMSMQCYNFKPQQVNGKFLERDTRYPRQLFQKHKLKEMFPDVYDPTLSEAQILEKKEIYQIWNSGCWKYRLPL
jgi:hypothetical protein